MKYFIRGTRQEIEILGWSEDTNGLLIAYAFDVESGETLYVHESNIESKK